MFRYENKICENVVFLVRFWWRYTGEECLKYPYHISFSLICPIFNTEYICQECICEKKESMRRVDLEGILLRSRQLTILSGRHSSVPGTNAWWHINGNQVRNLIWNNQSFLTGLNFPIGWREKLIWNRTYRGVFITLSKI